MKMWIIICIIDDQLTATSEGETSSNIVEMIEELTQVEVTEDLKISTEVSSIRKTPVVEESSQPRELPEGLPPSSPQPGNIPAFDNLPLGVVTDIIVMVVGCIAQTQVKEPLMGTGVEDIHSTSDRISIAVVETGSGSTPLVPTLAMDILERLFL